ncbi:MAG: hypothetical protein WB815_01060 [Nitrososphaeraceae archaeon]
MSHPLYTISRNLGTIAVLVGHLLKGLFIALGRKAITDGMPKSIQLARWLKNQTIFLVRKLKEAGRPKVMEAGQISKVLLIFTAQNLTKGVPIVLRIVQSVKGVSILFYGKAKRVVKEKIYVIRQDMASEQAKASESASIPSSSDIVLKNEEMASPNERLAQEIIQNGIECKAMTNTGSLAIIKKPYYSYLFAMSPRIITNRGCIRLSEGNSTRNIDFIQIVQKN